MKAPRFLLLVLAALFAVMTPRPADARTEVSFDFFYDSLSPYGEWLQVADYGFCWRPTDMDEDWTPYSDGYWAYTDAGWTWVSYEDFGGIVYHYGRWVRVEDEGWCWVPDYEWGPAWVSWRNSDDYVGWAPLPPEARWQPSVGISVWVDRDYDIGPAYYNFCHTRDFGAPVLRPVIINRIENVTIIRRTVNITNITYNTHYGHGPIVYCGGPNYAIINQRSARRVPALKLVQNVNIDLDGMRGARRGDRRINFNGRAEGNQLLVTAPYVKPPKDPGFLKPQVKKVIAADKVTRGWGMVKNDEVRKELRQEMNRQTRGLTRDTTPAKAVAVNDLKVLPEKADPKAPSPLATREPGDRPGRDGREDKDRPGRDKDGKTPNVAGQPSGPGDGPGRMKPGTPAVTTPDTDKGEKDRPGRDKNGKTPSVAGQPSGPGDGADGRTKPPTLTIPPKPPVATTPDVDDKTPGKGRGPMGRDVQKPGESGLKPFNPTADTDRNDRKGRDKDQTSGAPGTDPRTPDTRVTKPTVDPTKTRDAEQQQRQAEFMRQQQERKAAEAAADQDKARKQADAAAKMQQQQNALRLQQQKEGEAAAARQKMQADQQERAARAATDQDRARKQSEAAAKMQQQRDAFRAQQQQQQNEAASRQKMQADQQERAARAAAQQQKMREAGEQARRAQDAQREQMMRQQQDSARKAQESARRAQESQRQQLQQNSPPPGRRSSDSDDDDKRKKRN